MKKLCFIIIDGMGDSHSFFRTLKVPNLDELAKEGMTGEVYPIRGIAPQSDPAIFSLLGYSLSEYTGRGPIEALGAGLNFKGAALRTNFATVSGSPWKWRLVDRRAGRTLTTKETKALEKAINCIKLTRKFRFISTIEHRGILTINGTFNAISNTDATYKKVKGIGIVGKGGIEKAKGLGSEIINEFVEKSYGVLSEHPINKKRIKKGLLPANIILTRDCGTKIPKFPAICERTNRKWLAVVGMPAEKGIAKATGMDIHDVKYPPMTSKNVYTHLYKNLNAEIKQAKKALKENYDAFWLHFKETDIPGHDGNCREKKKMIEYLDSFFAYLLKEKFITVVTADHATPCSAKKHTKDPVPLLVYGLGQDKIKKFADYHKGSLGKINGRDLLKKILG
jgi:2,3-bisphosphoglycerate-independent phosphoglycerate mutase